MRELKNACNDSVIIADVSAFPIYCENLIVQNQLLAALHKRREIRCFLYNGYIYQSPFFCIIPASSVLEINSRTCFSDSISANISLRTARLIQPFYGNNNKILSVFLPQFRREFMKIKSYLCTLYQTDKSM